MYKEWRALRELNSKGRASKGDRFKALKKEGFAKLCSVSPTDWCPTLGDSVSVTEQNS